MQSIKGLVLKGLAMSSSMNKKKTIAEIMHSLRRIFKAIQQYSEEVLKEFGVTGPQLWALRTVYVEGQLSMGELSRTMYLHMSTVSGVVDRLEEKGYLERTRGVSDRRVVKISLTKAGKKLVQRGPEAAQGRLLHGLESLSPKEVQVIWSSLEKVVRLMEIQDTKATFFFSEE
ncbi:MAG: MarR family transcriptional regulator [Nitrospirae bacterium]|nr:MarR family transcriptional regulator [Nitrospirota bacterium]